MNGYSAREAFLRRRVEEQMTGVPAALRYAPKATVWAYPPQWHWFGWQTLLPVQIGHDEHSRTTLMLGWTITGRLVLPLWYCGDEECYRQSLD